MSQPKSDHGTRRILPKIALSLAVFVVLFPVLDLTVGHIDCRRKLRELADERAAEQARTSPNYPMTESQAFHHNLKANFDAKVMWAHYEYNLRTDSMSFKAPEIGEVPTTSPSWRILFLGDSFTEGVGFEAERTFVGLVQRRLEESGLDVEVFNAGLASYSPKLYLLKTIDYWENRGFRFDEVWTFIDPSDPVDELSYAQFEPTGFEREIPLHRKYRLEKVVNDPSFFERSVTYRTWMKFWFKKDPWNRTQYRDLATGLVLDYYGGRDQWTVDEEHYLTWGQRGLESAAFHMEQLTNFLRENGVLSGIAVYPWPRELQEVRDNSRNVAFWSEFAEEHDLPLMNLYPAFREGAPEEVIEDLYIKGDVHFNEAGHAVVAEGWLRHRESVKGFPSLGDHP